MKQPVFTVAMCGCCQKMTEQELLTIFLNIREEYQDWKVECTICKTSNDLRLENTESTVIENYDVLEQLEMIPTSSSQPKS